MGIEGLFQQVRAVHSLAEGRESAAEVVLFKGPIIGSVSAGEHPQRCAMGGNGLFKPG